MQIFVQFGHQLYSLVDAHMDSCGKHIHIVCLIFLPSSQLGVRVAWTCIVGTLVIWWHVWAVTTNTGYVDICTGPDLHPLMMKYMSLVH